MYAAYQHICYFAVRLSCKILDRTKRDYSYVLDGDEVDVLSCINQFLFSFPIFTFAIARAIDVDIINTVKTSSHTLQVEGIL